MRLFSVGAELRWLMASLDWPDTVEFRETLDAFQAAYEDAARGTRVVDVLSTLPIYADLNTLEDRYDQAKEFKLDRSTYETLVRLIDDSDASGERVFCSIYGSNSHSGSFLPRSASAIWKLECDRATFGTRDKNFRNSFVCFKDPLSDRPSDIVAGQISSIFLHSRSTLR